MSFEEAARELRRLFFDSVRLHLRADVPVAAALSGGIDSSAVVAAMRGLEGDALDLHAFSFVAPGHPANEEAWADLAGSHAQATMHKVRTDGRDLVGAVDSLIEAQGEPFGSTSIFAQSQVYKEVHQAGIKVTVDGQGADEMLAGYVPFLGARLASIVRSGEFLRATRYLCQLGGPAPAAATIGRAARFVLPLGLQAVARRCVGEGLIPGWMNGAWMKSRGVEIKAPQGPRTGRVLTGELADSLEHRVLPALLRYQDRNSMAYSVESRVPFLTTSLVDFIYSLPEDFLISDAGETKSVFRAAMRDAVPAAILERRDKIGFVTPQATWLREMGDWLTQVSNSDAARRNPALNHSALSAAVANVRDGRHAAGPDIWRLANLIKWSEIFGVEFNH